MNSKELRIGNLVQISNEAKIGLEEEGFIINVWDVKGLQNTEIVVYNEPEGITKCFESYDINPILLTEEWLIKFGFERKNQNEYVKDIFIYRKTQNDLVINGYEYDYNGILHHPEYVHKLQNLYFALTCEELTIKN